ncbi:hypothetical protein [Corynebacterium casei]|uniref:hypothetical protein n=1 Tax=Corynebacterium casei TaxID=160386 RepID=UPI003FCFAD09
MRIGHFSYSLHGSQHRHSYAHSPHQSFTIIFYHRKILSNAVGANQFTKIHGDQTLEERKKTPGTKSIAMLAKAQVAGEGIDLPFHSSLSRLQHP